MNHLKNNKNMKEAFYFTHDYNVRNDIKIKKLLSKHKWQGYGIFWALIEELYNNANALPLDYECISFDLNCDVEIVESIINDFGLFIIEEGFFKSLSIEKRLDKRNEKSSKARESALYRWSKCEDDANALQDECEDDAIKERKGKEIKGKENKENNNSFDFKNSLIDYGFKKELVDDWIKVRKNKKLTNTQVAFKKFIKQVEINGRDINEILERCIEKSWGGFESDWFKSTINNNSRRQEIAL